MKDGWPKMMKQKSGAASVSEYEVGIRGNQTGEALLMQDDWKYIKGKQSASLGTVHQGKDVFWFCCKEAAVSLARSKKQEAFPPWGSHSHKELGQKLSVTLTSERHGKNR